MLDGGMKGLVVIARGLEWVLSNEGSSDSWEQARRLEKDLGNCQGVVGNPTKESCIVGLEAHLRKWNKQGNGPQYKQG